MLNNAYCRANGKSNLRATCSKVHLHLNREGRKHIHFHGFHRSFALHKSAVSGSDAFVNGYKWVFMCEICLWNSCLVWFSREFVSDDGEYTGVVDSAKELLQAVDVVHRLTTNNITFQCEDPHHSVEGALAIGHEEDEDRQRYCMVCGWYVEYGRFCIFLKNING
ncbi:unnamed protein product [Lactuca saligna]|uniref:Uncharacterized protein n=1 Tax=Lactuca saligna TaxID=75948 RepID=A0AA35VTK2_LACSI|nr:unnamed protein product [Lactuca saligna]